MSSYILLHQYLHGYQNGHKLLKQSLEIPSSILSKLMRLSDFSGDRVSLGFDSYITGYPLPELDSYAFAKTWYAHEMPRPGCVWTHTILIQRKHLEDINNLEVIFDQFANPRDKKTLNAYSEQIEIKKKQQKKYNENIYIDSLSEQIIEKLVKVLFDDVCEILIPSDSANNYEELMALVWLRLWPTAKMNFRFCTGSLENRSFSGEKFDIQIIPRSNQSAFIRSNTPIYILDTNSNRESNELYTSKWLFPLVREFKSQSGLMEFLWEVAEDISDFRKYTRTLVNIYLLLDTVNKNSLEILLNQVCKIFPQQEDGKKLKTVLFSANSKYKWPKAELVENLINPDVGDAYSPYDLNFEEIVRGLCSENIKTVYKLLVDSTSKTRKNDFYQAFLAVAFSQLPISMMIELVSKSNMYLFLVLSVRPSLAFDLISETDDVEKRLQILDILLKNNNETQTLSRIMIYILKYTDDILLLEEICTHRFELFLSELINFLKENNNASLITRTDNKLQMIFSSKQVQLLQWVKNLHSINNDACYILSYINPNSDEIFQTDYHYWIQLQSQINSSLSRIKNFDDSYTSGINSFFLSLGFRFSKEISEARTLIENSFDSVYTSLHKNKLNYRHWKMLECHVPTLGANDWDKCERLIRGLIDLIDKMEGVKILDFDFLMNNDEYRNKIENYLRHKKKQINLSKTQF
jgi:hypothetical protein